MLIVNKTVTRRPVDPKRPHGRTVITGLHLTLREGDATRVVRITRGELQEEAFLQLHRETVTGKRASKYAREVLNLC